MQKTSIGWTDYSSNPIRVRLLGTAPSHAEISGAGDVEKGWFCTKVNRGCKNCYAETLNKRFGNGLEYSHVNRDKVKFVLNQAELDDLVALNARLAKRGETAKVFIGDMLDIFHEDVSDLLLIDLFKVFAETPNLTYQLLTKRYARMTSFSQAMFQTLHGALPNVWMGMSVSDPETLHEVMPHMSELAAEVAWLSYEPMVAAANLVEVIAEPAGPEWAGWNQLVNWVVIGGESGAFSEVANIDMVGLAAMIGDCFAMRVPVFVKQLGTLWAREHIRPNPAKDYKAEQMQYWPEWARVRQFPNHYES